jgi:PDZ domain-containing protein
VKTGREMRIAQEPTDRGMVLPSPLGWQPIPGRRRSVWTWLVAGMLVLVAAFIVLHLVTVPYVAYVPGEALPVNGVHGAVTVGGHHVGAGNVYLVTIAEQTRVSEWDRLTAGWLHKDWTIIPTKAVTGGLSPARYNQVNAQMMADSQEYAKVAALRRLGYQVPERGDGAAVVQVDARAPASGQFLPSDVITAVDGKAISISSEVGVDIRAHPSGTPVEFTVKRTSGSASRTVQLAVTPVPCGSACPGDAQRPIIGVAVTTDNQSFDLPKNVDLSIATQGIGGPSAGLAFTLGALDALTTHRLTGGAPVAATGTIDPTGGVGEVGGVVQKTITVERQGARYFIVPRGEAADAMKTAKGHALTIVPVDTLDQALTFLRGIGGDLSGIPVTTVSSPA